MMAVGYWMLDREGEGWRAGGAVFFGGGELITVAYLNENWHDDVTGLETAASRGGGGPLFPLLRSGGDPMKDHANEGGEETEEVAPISWTKPDFDIDVALRSEGSKVNKERYRVPCVGLSRVGFGWGGGRPVVSVTLERGILRSHS